MPDVLQRSDYLRLIADEVPLLDVRAPIEFTQGALPCAQNLPLLDDAQRHEIGLQYAQQGEEAAIALGLELATPEIKSARIAAWKAYLAAHPDAALYCFRGGLRSRTTQQWLAEAGVEIALISGGYKALRRTLLNTLEQLCAEAPLVVVTGLTGVGKTELIHRWHHALDLEACASHRGSAFGRCGEQPSQASFENRLISRWWQRFEADPKRPLLIEDESRLIGRVALPPALLERIQSAPRIALSASKEERVQRLRNDYLAEAQDWEVLQQDLLAALGRISKRLGGERSQDLIQQVRKACAAQASQRDLTQFDAIVAALLEHYYDPLYRHGSAQAPEPLCQGHQDELLQWLRYKTSY